MKISNSALTAAILLLFILNGLAQDTGLPEPSEDRLRKHVFFLASDSLKGRGIGTPGLTQAARYLKDNLQEMNVGSPGDGFFQPFALTSSNPDKQNSAINLFSKKGRVKQSTRNFIAYNQNSDSVEVEGELVFAGFGPASLFQGENNDTKPSYDGKIILYSAGKPSSFTEKTSYQWNSAEERKKMDVLFEAGAKALILATSIHDSANATYSQLEKITARQTFSMEPHKQNENPKIFIVTPETADELTGNKLKWRSALKAVSENRSPATFALKNNRVTIKALQSRDTIEAANVLGLIEGSDPSLKQECIVFVSHYDHLGTGANGEIYNGADDNASGVAVLLEVAGMFSRLREKPKRSILFLFPSAEEIGLFGSGYYSRNPLFPMEKTAACINLDMVGRVYEPRDSVWADSPKQVKDFNGIYALVNHFNANLKELTVEASNQLDLVPDFNLPGQFFFTSDHYHFHRNQVPVLNISTGYSADYHKPTDTADRIRTDKLKRIAQLCFLAGMELANGE